MYDRLIGVARAVVQPKGRHAICRLLNLSSTTTTLPANKAIAYLQEINMQDDFNVQALQRASQQHLNCMSMSPQSRFTSTNQPLTTAEKRKALEDRGLSFKEYTLSNIEFAKLCDLVYDYKYLFITDERELPESKLPQVEVPLKSDKIVRLPQFRLAPSMAIELQKRLDQLEKAGIIEQSTSPYNSPTFLVRKFSKPGDPPSYRLVTDFRKINELIHDIYYGMTDIDQCIDMISTQLKPPPGVANGQEPKNLYLSILDCKSGFYSLVLKPGKSRACTAISGPKGHYNSVRLPRGLKCSSILYSLALTNLLRDVLNTEKCLIYQDDIIVATTTLDNHLETLKAIFDKYTDAKVRFNAHKTSLCVPRATYLGWTIDRQGLSVDKKRCEVINRIKTPTTIKQLRSFLGCVIYWKKRLPKLPTIAAPLYELLRKDVQFHWGPEQQHAFQKIKDMMMSDLVLAWPAEHAQATRPYILEVDGSIHGLGCLLKQADENGE